MNACPVCGQLHAPNCLRAALQDLRDRPVFKAPEPHCPFCNYPRSDGMQTHAWDCEWCTLAQRLDRIENFLMPGGMKPVERAHGQPPEDKQPDTQRTGTQRGKQPGCRVIVSHDHLGGGFIAAPTDPREPRPDASAAEPERAEAAGAVPAGGEPGRAEGPGAGDGRADSSGDREPAAEE